MKISIIVPAYNVEQYILIILFSCGKILLKDEGDILDFSNYWDNIHKNYTSSYDGWLEKYLPFFNTEKVFLELGTGFTFVGSEYKLEVGGKEYIIDLLFYHLKLKCYIVVQLKAREFEPTDAGQLNFYLSAVDDLVKDKDDNATIGLLLCKGKDNFTAEYALKDINKPIGVSEYKLLEDMPEYLQSQLPRAEDIELHIKDVEEIEEQEDN